jgi:hypothetical protein
VIPGEKEQYGLFSDTEEEIEEWLRTLDHVVKLMNNPRGGSRRTSESSEVAVRRSKSNISRSESLKDALRNSVHPELLKYAGETDAMNALKRKEGRLQVFEVYPDLDPSACLAQTSNTEPPFPEDHFNKRILIELEDLKFRITAFIAKNVPLSHVEPFFTSAALYDVSKGCKLSEDFHFNLNDPASLDMISGVPPPLSPISASVPQDEKTSEAKTRKFSQGRQDFPTFSKRVSSC